MKLCVGDLNTTMICNIKIIFYWKVGIKFMIKLKSAKKNITIYNENSQNQKNMPFVIYNSYKGDGKELWNLCNKLSCNNFVLICIDNILWDDEMTPWYNKPLYKNDNECNGKADNYLNELINKIIPDINKNINIKPKFYALTGYSLGGLFAIYSLYKTNIFSRIVSASSSLWYPNFIEYAKENDFVKKPDKIYMSLGDEEKNSNIKLLSTVEQKTLELYKFYNSNNIDIKFEFNNGNHFNECDLRVAKGIKYILE